jgi:hypothetical protein
MPLQLPNLDDLRWKDLLEEGRSLIAASSSTWTNHNPSDPGITLMELFAFLSGTLMYQLNRITEADTANYLNLLAGPGQKPGKFEVAAGAAASQAMRGMLTARANAEKKQQVFRSLPLPQRAVTAEDYELLVSAWPGVARAKCLSDKNLDNEDARFRWMDAPGHISVVVLPAGGTRPTPELLAEVRQALEPMRLLTIRLHAVPPRQVQVQVRLSVVATPHFRASDDLAKAIAARLNQFFDPYRGWFDDKGWPMGRNLYISELYERVAGIDGVESVSPVWDAQGVFEDEISVAAEHADRILRDRSGRVQALVLQPDELLAPQIHASQIKLVKHDS